MLIELSGSINNFAISKNTPSVPARCLESFQETGKKKSGQWREGATLKGMHSYFLSGDKSLSTLALINWPSPILQNSYENPG